MSYRTSDTKEVRRLVRQILYEQRLGLDRSKLLFEEDSLYNVFVEPFADIVRATAITGQTILSALKLNLKVLISLDPDTIKKAHDEFDKRQGEIDKKWEPIMKRNRAAGGGDAQLVAFMLAPQMYMGASLAKGTYNAAGGIHAYLEDAGWSVPLAGIAFPKGAAVAGAGGAAAGAASGGAADANKHILTRAKGALGKLAGLFFIAHHAPEGTLIAEAAEEEAPPPPKPPTGNFEEDLKEYLQQTGMADAFEEEAKKVIDVHKDHFNEVVSNMFVPKAEALSALAAAADWQAFQEALDKLLASGAEFQKASLGKIKKTLADAAEELTSDEEFVKSLQDQKGEGEEVSPDEVRQAAAKVAFSSAKVELQKQLVDGLDQLKVVAKEELSYNMPNEEELKEIGKSSVGAELEDALKTASKKIDSYKANE